MIYTLYAQLDLNTGSHYLEIITEAMKSILNHDFQEPTSSFRLCAVPDIQLTLARAYYHLRDFDCSQQYYSKIPDAILGKVDHFMIAMNLAHKGLWKDSFIKFLNYDLFTGLDLTSEDNNLSFEADVLLILEVVLRGCDKKFNSKETALILKSLKTIYPESKPDFDHLFKNIQRITEKEKETRLQKLRQLQHQAMASQQFQDISSQYDSFDIQYQNVWVHSSFLPSEQMTSILNPLNAIAQEIHQNYELFKALEKNINDYAKNVGKIMELAQGLRKDLEQFFYTKININDQISGLRRQHKKQNSKKKKEDFIEFKSITILETKNLKKRICDEHKSTLKQAEKKQKLSQDVQKERQQRREFLTKAYEEQQQKKSTNEITNILEPSPFHFTNTAIQKFWETCSCSWETLNFKDQKIVEILKALDAAKNMQHLRSLLTPGTKLGRLSGNREDQLSLRINDQWRLCFYWITGQGPIDIDLVDYHA